MTIAIARIAAMLLTAAQEPPLVAPIDWAAMPPLPWRSEPVLTPDLAAFVGGEVRAGRCVAPRASIEVELAVLVRADGRVRSVVPRAIGCPTVEQFAAGLVSSFTRNNLRAPAAGWYRAAITFEWGR